MSAIPLPSSEAGPGTFVLRPIAQRRTRPAKPLRYGLAANSRSARALAVVPIDSGAPTRHPAVLDGMAWPIDADRGVAVHTLKAIPWRRAALVASVPVLLAGGVYLAGSIFSPGAERALEPSLAATLGPVAAPGLVPTLYPPIPPSGSAQATALEERATLLARQKQLLADLNQVRELSAALRLERNTLQDNNERLVADNDALMNEADALMAETTELNKELLELELALAAAEQREEDSIERRTVYNFVDVPIGSPIPSSGPQTLPAGDPAPLMQTTEVAAAAMTQLTGDEMVEAFYRELHGGEPVEVLNETLDRIGQTGLVSGERLYGLYQELTYLWEE